MENKLDQLKIILGEVADLYAVASLLEWDQHVYMPPGWGERPGQPAGDHSKIGAHEIYQP